VGSPNDLEIVVLFDAPRELVFRNWTEAAKVQTWFAPDGSAVTACQVSARPGGRWRVEFRAPDGTECLEYGEFREVVEPDGLQPGFRRRRKTIREAVLEWCTSSNTEGGG
jgi:uncharacterized protein YndB with AHSA1/START domain